MSQPQPLFPSRRFANIGRKGFPVHPAFGYYSIWPVILCTALLTGLAATNPFRIPNSPITAHPHSHRVRAIDGLRGYLSLAVVFHHVSILRLYLERGAFEPDDWELPPSRFFSLLGPAAVSMFFMITGYLFWSRVLKKRARLNWSELYIGRVFRIGPLYVVAVGVALLFDYLTKTHGIARVATTSPMIKQTMSLSLLGLSVYPDSNKFLAGVTWSIQYEWLFYMSLPVLARVFLRPRLQMPLLVTILAACLAIRASNHTVIPGTRTFPIMAGLFLIGMICATLQERDLQMQLPDWVMSVFTIALLASVFAFPDVYAAGPALLLGGAFYLICSGCSFFGLLTSPGATRLGDVSYGIYLLQGLAFALCLRPTPFRGVFLRSPANYWLMTFVTLIVLVFLAKLTYVAIERGGIELGRRIAAKVDRVLGLDPSVA